MRAHFNYAVFWLRILFVVGWSVLLIIVFFLMPGMLSGKHDMSGIVGIMVVYALLFGMMSFKFWRAILTERYSIGTTPDEVIIKDHLLFRSFGLRYDEIKGFSLSEYPIRIKGVKSILLYLVHGRKIEVPQFLFLGFKQLTSDLKESGVKYLGEEGYVWKWVDSRVYKFDK